MQFIDLKTQYKKIQDSVNRRMDAVLEHGNYILGPEVQELEQKLAEYCGTKYCLSCASGTDALLLSLMAMGIGPKNAVFTTPFTFIATAEVIAILGATPVFVDINPKTYNIDPEKLDSAIKDVINEKKLKPGCIIPVDIFGLPADYDSINKIANKYKIQVIEDAAQSFGGVYKGKKTCNLADMAATSFFPSKPLGCYGDGGAVFTNNKYLADRVSSLRIHGKGVDKYNNIQIGINSRLDTLQAAILLAKLEVFEEELINRKKIANFYSENLKNISIPITKGNIKSSWALYSVLSDDRKKIIQTLKTKGIPTAIYYPKPLHLLKAFSFLHHKQGDFKISESVSQKIFSLPMHPYLKNKDLISIVSSINSIV